MKLFSVYRPRAPRARSYAGSTLAATMMVIAAIVTFLSISALITSQFGRYAERQQGDVNLMNAADAAQEYAYAQWLTALKPVTSSSKPYLLTAQLTPINATMLAAMQANTTFAAAGVQFDALGVYGADQSGSPITIDNSSTPGVKTSNVPGYPGWTGTTYGYVSTVTVQPNAANYHFGFLSSEANNTTAKLLTTRRYFSLTTVPLFQAAIFYENKLEIHPGAGMVVTGLVHTNADLWARGFSTLQFKSNVSYVSSFNEIGDATVTKGWDGSGGGYIPGIGPFAGVPLVTWSDGLTSSNSTAKATQLNKVSPIDPFAGASTSNNGLHDLVEVPTAGSTNATNQQVAFNNAAVVVTINSSLPLLNPLRVLVTDNTGAPLSLADTAAIKAAVGNGATTIIYDQREASNIIVTTLDMTKLAAATVAAPGQPQTALQARFQPNTAITPSGTIYIHDISPTTATESAIKLINGQNLGQNVTVASDNGVYIQGDYNTGLPASGSKVPSDDPTANGYAAGTATPQVAGYNRYSSAVMADAVTILSNAWSDSNASASLSSRIATPTTVNTAILAGDVPSNLNSNGIASGGAHNFPRFLENWNNVNFTYYGSLVEAYRSETFNGTWQTGNVYYWPNRMWNFDTNFVNTPPPGSVSGVQYSRGRWERD